MQRSKTVTDLATFQSGSKSWGKQHVRRGDGTTKSSSPNSSIRVPRIGSSESAELSATRGQGAGASVEPVENDMSSHPRSPDLVLHRCKTITRETMERHLHHINKRLLFSLSASTNAQWTATARWLPVLETTHKQQVTLAPRQLWYSCGAVPFGVYYTKDDPEHVYVDLPRHLTRVREFHGDCTPEC